MRRLVISDAPFTQTAIAILVTLSLALLLQAKLLGAPGSHPISTRGRRWLVTFELHLFTVLAADGIVLGYLLFHHLASAEQPFTPLERREVELFLWLLLIGLAFIAAANRVVAVAWRAPERPYLEPELDGDLMSNLYVAFILALSVSTLTLILLLIDQHLLACLAILFFGAVAAFFGPFLATVIDARADRVTQARLADALEKDGYETSLGDMTLPGGLDQITVKVFQSPTPERPDCVAVEDALRLVRHINGARADLRRRDPHAEVPTSKLRIARTRDSRSTVVAEAPEAGIRRVRSSWARQPASGAPRGLVAWVAGEDIPRLPD